MQQPRCPEGEFAAETWYSADPHDIFSEEFAIFLLGAQLVRNAFMKYHSVLLETEFWQQKQEDIKACVFEDVFPYPPSIRFPRTN